MSRSNCAIFGSLLAIWVFSPCVKSQADVIVYKETAAGSSGREWPYRDLVFSSFVRFNNCPRGAGAARTRRRQTE